MTSQINPNNINGAYPVAGQDNNSQGFRDNFTNTSTNFGFAADEITDLQNKAILKAALTGQTLNNDMLGSPLSNAVLSDMAYRATTVALTGNVPINYSAAQYWSVVAGGSISLDFTNGNNPTWPASPNAGVVVISVNITNPSYTLTLPASVAFQGSTTTVNTAGIVGLVQNYSGLTFTGSTITFPTAGIYTFTFTTTNGGTTFTVTETNKQLQPFNASSAIWSSGAINLAVTTTIFNGAASATLANGVSGQVVVLVQTGNPGTATITVATPGWGGAGTIVLNAQGEAVTLMFTDGGWFCIGNNGATFA